MKDIMDHEYQLPFKVGQLTEAMSFKVGFRGAWFRCKIKEISRKRGHWHALLEYFDYPDEKLTWTKLYQVPQHLSGKSKKKRQLMLRPQYPPICLRSEVSDVCSTSDAIIVVDGTWQVGDLVDWWQNDCYWSGQLTKLLDNGKAEIFLTPPPMGEGAMYEVFVKDLRPSLNWFLEFGWTVPLSQNGENSRRCAQVIQPVNGALGELPVLEIHPMSEGRKGRKAKAGSSSDVSFSTHLSANSLPASDENWDSKTTEFVRQPSSTALPKVVTSTSKENSSSGSDSGFRVRDDAGKEARRSDEKRDFKTTEFVRQPSSTALPKVVTSTSKETSRSGSYSGFRVRGDAGKEPRRSDEKRDFKTTEFVRQPSSTALSKVVASTSKETSRSGSDSGFRVRYDAGKETRWSDEKRDFKTTEFVGQPLSTALPEVVMNTSKETSMSGSDSGFHIRDDAAKETRWSDNESGTPIGDDAATTAGPTGENLYYTGCPLKKFRSSGGTQLHSTGSDSLEAAIMDLEELANKINWLKGLIGSGHRSSAVRPSWKFVEHIASARKN